MSTGRNDSSSASSQDINKLNTLTAGTYDMKTLHKIIYQFFYKYQYLPAFVDERINEKNNIFSIVFDDNKIIETLRNISVSDSFKINLLVTYFVLRGEGDVSPQIIQTALNTDVTNNVGKKVNILDVVANKKPKTKDEDEHKEYFSGGRHQKRKTSRRKRRKTTLQRVR